MDVVVTVPKSFGLDTWIAEGDPASAFISSIMATCAATRRWCGLNATVIALPWCDMVAR